MEVDLDTFLVTVYCLVDEVYAAELAPHRPARPGPAPALADSEVLTLLLIAQWQRTHSERAFLRHAAAHWRAYFPRLLSQSAFNRRARDLAGALTRLVALLADRLGAPRAAYQALDGVPVPLLRRCRGQRHKLFAAEAAIGRGGSDRDFYYGCQLLLSVTDAGAITGFVLGPADTEGHWLAEALLCWRRAPRGTPWTPADLPARYCRRKRSRYVGPTGPVWPRDGAGRPSRSPYIGDGGFRGAGWAAHWQADYGACVVTPQRYRAATPGALRAARRQHAAWRQVVETVNEHLEHVFGLPFPGARTWWGLRARVAAKLAALNLGLWLNRRLGRPAFALATLVPA